jgi:hypothetical protein
VRAASKHLARDDPELVTGRGFHRHATRSSMSMCAKRARS